ncbi:helix-turn-helix domain-containing protein [Streptococcus sp. zg-86]|uniref:Helix-turn-helix domain-containing protein n=1 Tax=Streptococcus zhangguiae TaxID=2664091 RepID=A0A6I4RET5_9STRE|nr:MULTISPECIES: AraC family transcriptional regulator [Streptococcus]MTB64016.1 helix-turn-helix domain-containing protein [Streptococcus sp. zg-86]MTB90326.1 helix-turn-helix domain-containing protein [Streptococcus sp. zg-36]MWV56004.1 helix-turn-helix domain-containing protein [Streptococcus sp. zg-70]QTH47042.1 AraC family transcriptional regulator [Streptococcus sp. zg-86]
MEHYLRQYTDRFTDFNNKHISDLILYSSGIEYCRPNHSYSLRSRDYHVILFVKEGKGTFEIEEKHYIIQQNQLFIIPAGYWFRYTADTDNPWKYSWIGFLGIKSNFIYQASKQHQFVFDCKNAEDYEALINQMLDVSENTFSSFLKINGFMYTLLGKLVEEIGILDQVSEQQVSTLARHYMDLHYHEIVQIADVADFIGIHPNYLAHLFKKETGISPKQYLSTLRIKKAKELLIETSYPINTIAHSVGFSDALSFSKFFKKETAIAPTTYRKEYKHDVIHHI